MELRNHPAMNYRGVSNWPPVWLHARAVGAMRLNGESGVLKYVHASNHLSNKCYLVIEHESTQYVGCLIFQDAATNSPACCANIKGDEGDRRSGAISFCYEPA